MSLTLCLPKSSSRRDGLGWGCLLTVSSDIRASLFYFILLIKKGFIRLKK